MCFSVTVCGSNFTGHILPCNDTQDTQGHEGTRFYSAVPRFPLRVPSLLTINTWRGQTPNSSFFKSCLMIEQVF